MGTQNGKISGAGVGYRSTFRDTFFSGESLPISWIEAITENYFSASSRAREDLRALRARFPVALHGVGLNLASADALDERYLRELSSLVHEIEPWLVTDHLCWTGVKGENLFDLLPFPYTDEALALVAGKVQRVQDLLRRPLAVENITYYLSPAGSVLGEAEFLNELCARTGCKLLLDVNNVFVNSVNLGFDPVRAIDRFDLSHVAEIHLAGHTENRHGLLIDTHGSPVRPEVWELYRHVAARGIPIPAMIERDQNIPAFAELIPELSLLRQIQEGGRHAASRLAASVP